MTPGLTTAGQPALVCRNVAKSYRASRGPTQALQDVTFSVAAGEFVAIVGPSGCGKTTLLRLLAGLDRPTSGHISFSDGSCAKVSRLQRALIFQEHGLFPWMTVVDNVAFGLETQGVERRERRERARAFLAQVGLGAFAYSYPHELSVGMRQRVAIARAFLTRPDLLLMDEPFSALDAQSRLVMQEELLRIWKSHQATVVYVTHDIEEAILLGDRVLVMSGHPSRIREEIRIPLGRPRDLHDREQIEVKEIKWHIWKAIEAEVRQSLNVRS